MEVGARLMRERVGNRVKIWIRIWSSRCQRGVLRVSQGLSNYLIGQGVEIAVHIAR